MDSVTRNSLLLAAGFFGLDVALLLTPVGQDMPLAITVSAASMLCILYIPYAWAWGRAARKRKEKLVAFLDASRLRVMNHFAIRVESDEAFKKWETDFHAMFREIETSLRELMPAVRVNLLLASAPPPTAIRLHRAFNDRHNQLMHYIKHVTAEMGVLLDRYAD